MRRLYVIYALLLTAALDAAAQVVVKGVVTEADGKGAVAGASVIMRNAHGKIKKYASTAKDGSFSISTDDVGGCMLVTSMMGYAKDTVRLDGSTHFPLRIVLRPETFVLREVAVKSDRIREQGDTISYRVGAFAQEQDRTIGDVLKRMPGIDVEKNGKIKYQGEDINKFYIEGSDLLGGRYGLATNGISHDDVGAVEVMENHQPMQVLSGISFSDKAAINLKLKNKAKTTWSFHGDAAGGWAWQSEGAVWDGELFAMAVMAKFQNITTLKTNNTGEDLASSNTDFFADRRHTALSGYVNLALPGVPTLDSKRTMFNRSFLVSTNNLWKMKNGELKANIDYSFNRMTADASSVTTYFLNSGNRVITENRSGTDHTHSLNGKVIYELNRKTAFVNNTLQTEIDWDDIRLTTAGSLSNSQSARMPDYFLRNNFKMIKRFGGKHLVTFYSDNQWESLPQTLNVTTDGTGLRQHVGDRAFYTEESAAYAFTIKGITVSLEGGVRGYFRSLDTKLPDIPAEIPGETQNVLNTNYMTVYATPKLEYWVKRVNITLNAPVSFARYTFDKALANRSEAYLSPSLSLNWKPDNHWNLRLRGSTGRSPMSLHLIQPGYIMSDYRTFRKGVDDFYNSTSQSLSATFEYKHTVCGFFANGFVLQSWSHMPYTMSQQLYGNYIVYSYSEAKSDGKMLVANMSMGKTLNFMRGSMNVFGTFNRNEAHLISENNAVNSVGTSWSVGAMVNGTVVHWLSFDYKFNFYNYRMTLNSVAASWLGSMQNTLLLNVMPHRKWEWHIEGEHYHNEIADNTFKDIILLDTRLIFKPTRRIELAASLGNILDRRTYNYTTYSQLSSFESQRNLRGRQFLFTLTLRK